jgi:fermentation-respiration switch protein FrsA (DUF1100 family)
MLVLVVLTAIGVLGAALAFNARTGSLERWFVYFPTGDVRATPADAGLGYEEVALVASDGVRIEGWFVPGPQPVTWLWFHGNAGNVGDRVQLIRELHEAVGASIFIVSYRGYGRSGGSPSEEGFYRDAQAALDYLLSRPDVDTRRIVYFGRSIGSAVAVQLAARREPLALVLEAPFPSLSWLARQVYPWLPVSRFLHEEYDVEGAARRVSAPALILQGERDEIVPLSGARAVVAALAGEVELVVVPGAGHNDVPRVAGAEYYRWIAAFLERVER